jgi:hypothetical protein
MKGSEDAVMRKREAITPETVMETGKQIRKSLLAVLTPEERLAGLAPEERLAGLTAEEMLVLMKQIEARLQQQQCNTQATDPKAKPQQPT